MRYFMGLAIALIALTLLFSGCSNAQQESSKSPNSDQTVKNSASKDSGTKDSTSHENDDGSNQVKSESDNSSSEQKGTDVSDDKKSKNDDKNNEKKGHISLSKNNGNVKIKYNSNSEEFNTHVGKNSKIPKAFPDNFPFPDKLKILATQSITMKNFRSYHVSFTIPKESMEKAYQAMKEYAKTLKVDLTKDKKTDNSFHIVIGNVKKEDKEYVLSSELYNNNHKLVRVLASYMVSKNK